MTRDVGSRRSRSRMGKRASASTAEARAAGVAKVEVAAVNEWLFFHQATSVSALLLQTVN